MIDLYTWGTPNGRKASIMLEEVELDYRAHPINIGKDEQFDPDFLKISPNNKIPAMVDDDGPNGEPLSMFESGAMLLYLARKTGKFLPTDDVAYFEVMQWLMFQMGGVGPMFGQAHHFRRFVKEDIPYARERYTNETKRLCSVMDKRLSGSESKINFFSAFAVSIGNVTFASFSLIHSSSSMLGQCRSIIRATSSTRLKRTSDMAPSLTFKYTISVSSAMLVLPSASGLIETNRSQHQTSYHIEMSGISVNNGRLERDRSVGIYPLVRKQMYHEILGCQNGRAMPRFVNDGGRKQLGGGL